MGNTECSARYVTLSVYTLTHLIHFHTLPTALNPLSERVNIGRFIMNTNQAVSWGP
jgi:hypothetical protein